MNKQSIFVRKSVPYRKMDGCSTIHLGSRQIYLNETGTRIWEQIDGQRTVAEVALAIAQLDRESFSSFEDAAKVAEDFVSDLFAKDLLVNSSQTSPGSTLVATSPESRLAAQTPTEGCQYRPASNGQASGVHQRKSTRDRIFERYWNKRYIEKLHLELTYRCNLRCCHCYNSTHSGASQELATAEWIGLLEQAAALGCYFLVFTGGEPFARKDIIEILQSACRLGFAFRINTNGSMIKEEHIPQMQAMQPFLQGVDISFYGATPQVHDMVTTRPGSYHRTRTVLDSLLQAKVPTVAKYVTMQMNFDGLQQFEDEMRTAEIPRAINTGSMIPRTDRNPAPLLQLLTDDQYKSMLTLRGDPKGGRDSTNCVPGWTRGAISSEGFVGPCEWLGDIKLGNVRKASLKDIWYGPGFGSLRESLIKADRECSHCELRTFCCSCPAHAYLETGSLFRCAPVQRHNAELCRTFFAAKA